MNTKMSIYNKVNSINKKMSTHNKVKSIKNGLIVDEYGNRRYYLNDLLHRVACRAAEDFEDGSKGWWVNGKRHRVDAPATELEDGSKGWWVNGKRHRVDGPAIEWGDGNKQWFFNDIELFIPKEFENIKEFIEKLNTNENYSLPFIHKFNGLIETIKNPTPKQKRLHAMKWKL